MAANTSPIFPVAPLLGIASLTSATPVTTRADRTGTAGLTQLTATTANGARIDDITVTLKGNSSAGAVDIWIYDSTTAHYFCSLDITAVTASTTTDPFTVSRSFSTLVLPPTHQLFVSETVAQDLTVFAKGGVY